MKRGLVFILLGILILSLFIAKAGVNEEKTISEEEIKSKISSEVLEKIEQEDNIRVYIKLKSEVKKGRSITSREIKKEVSGILEGKIKHSFDDSLSAFVSEKELLELQNNSNVESIELVGRRAISLQDSVPLINSSTELWNLQVDGINLTGKGETICIIDTGVNYSHSDLGGCYGNNDEDSSCKVLGGYDYCADDATCSTSDNDPMDAHWHGTHVSGIASANGSIKGVAPNAKIIMIKAANATGTFWNDDLEKAIDWCVNNASKFNISVISMSLGGTLYSGYCDASDVLSDEIDNAVAHNISVVVASGNDASTSQITGPACVQNAIPIGGTTKSDTMYSNGNRNSLILLLAPGVSINSTYTNGAYATANGTSMSTPHAAGAFAIINQYRRLEGLSDMIPSQIEDALNDSGKVIYDSGGSGLNFSRIQIYQTILEIDESGPIVTLNSPADDSESSNENQTFLCTATDVQLNNLTFYIWNSSGDLLDQNSFNATTNSLQMSVNQTLDNGTYTWNCLGYDNKSNSAWASSNYTLYIGNMLVTLNSPSHNSHTTSENVTFNCTSENTVANLSNVTLYVWNSSGTLKYNTTENISGTSNTTTFNYTLTSEASYIWNCMAYDEDFNSISGSSNYTLLYDDTNPVVTLESPDDEAEETEGSVDFEFNVSDANDIENCSLIIDSDITETDTSITKETTQTIDDSLTEGTYDWKIRCYDEGGNMDDSEEREITIEADDDDDDSSGSSSSSSDDDDDDDSTIFNNVPTTFIITDTDFEKGVSKLTDEGDKMKFNKNNDSHTLEVLDIASSKIKVKISSDPITLEVALGKTGKADLNNDKRYDIAVTYVKNSGSVAEIKIQSIDEEIPTRQISGNESNETTQQETTTATGKSIKELFNEMTITTKIIIGIIVGALLIGGFAFFIYKRHEKKLGPVYKKKYKK